MEIEEETEIVEDNHDGSSDTDQLRDSSGGEDGQSHIAIRPALKYPYGAMFFVMTSTVGLGLTSGGVIAILEFYFTHFLLGCLGKVAVGLGTASLNLFLTLSSLSGFFGGFQADKLLGSFATYIISYTISAIGTFLLALSTWMYTLSPLACCFDHSNNATDTEISHENCSAIATSITLKVVGVHVPPQFTITLAMIGLAMLAIGSGQLWLQSVFVGEQFDDRRQVNEQQRAFAWFYFWVSFGSLIGDLGLPILRQTTGYIVAYLATTGVAVISMIAFLSGSRFYVKKSPQRPTCKSSCYQRRQDLPYADSIALLTMDSAEGEEPDIDEEGVSENCVEDLSTGSNLRVPPVNHSPTDSPEHHDSIETNDSDTDPNNNRTDTKGKLKQLLPIFKIFVPLTLFWAIFFQRSSTWVVQATHMDCYLGSLHVPPDVMPSVEDVMVLLNLPVLEYLLYPHLRQSMGLEVKPIHKLTCGMTATALSFFLAGLLQIYITEPSEECRGDVSIAWQLPQLFLLSLGDVLVGITGLEVAYSLAPPDLRNTVTSFYYIVLALGTLMNAVMALIPISLLSSFFFYSGMMLAMTIVFAIMNRRVPKKEN